MSINRARRLCRKPRGFTLIELVMFIVIVSVGVVGILSVLNLTAGSSADPLIRKQMLAIAEGLIEEVELMPFTYCDPTDANAATATGATLTGSTINCATTVEALGPEVGEARTSAATPFNNVNDYNGCGPGIVACDLGSPIPDIAGISAAPNGYSAKITIANDTNFGVTGSLLASSEVLRIAVTVCHATSCPSLGADSLTLEGYRTRHSPNFTP
ncbi:MAG: prepilin-type N-terminal cleavage/methylation domain-containing protein [Betaproteobacteria bacterium]|nr:prepilin-type N-terminal cleavage/methylation domain-containing protein [Betaproteobacteria bacterium]